MEQEMLRLRKRSEFLAVQKGEKRRGALFLLAVKERTKPSFTGQIAKSKAKNEIKAEIGQQISFVAAEQKGLAAINSARAYVPRIGYTVTRKNGNAVCRNRIKRRLRAAVRLGGISALAAQQTDYVIIARSDVLTVPFPDLVEALRYRFQNIPSAKKHDRTARSKSPAKIAPVK